MAETAIQWATDTWNPTTGCDQISEGCDHCYALTHAARLKRMGQPAYQTDGDPRTSGPGFGLALHPSRLDLPLRQTRPRVYFVNSMSDLFHKDVPLGFIAEVFAVMLLADQHRFLVLTKRPKRMARMLGSQEFLRALADVLMRRDPERFDWRTIAINAERSGFRIPWPLPNVWAGITIENAKNAWRAEWLRQTPAAVRFISAEPLLGPLVPYCSCRIPMLEGAGQHAPGCAVFGGLDLQGVDWIIVGGESGHGARPMESGWVRDIMAQAQESGTAVFVKQLGKVLAATHGVGGKGGDPSRWPEPLRDLAVREMPSGSGVDVATVAG